MSSTTIGRSRVPQPASSTIGGLLERGELVSAYQPLIDLYGGETVGYEALIRGPRGSELERPDAIFAAAHEAGLEPRARVDASARPSRARSRAALRPGRPCS